MSEENKHIIFINGIPTTVDLTDVEPILNENKRLLKMNDNWYVVDKVFYDYVDKYKQVLDKIKEKGVMYYDPEYSKIYGELCSMPGANNTRTPVIVIDDEILELLEEIE